MLRIQLHLESDMGSCAFSHILFIDTNYLREQLEKLRNSVTYLYYS